MVQKLQSHQATVSSRISAFCRSRFSVACVWCANVGHTALSSRSVWFSLTGSMRAALLTGSDARRATHALTLSLSLILSAASLEPEPPCWVLYPPKADLPSPLSHIISRRVKTAPRYFICSSIFNPSVTLFSVHHRHTHTHTLAPFPIDSPGPIPILDPIQIKKIPICIKAKMLKIKSLNKQRCSLKP